MRHVPTHCRERRLRRIAVAVVVGLLLCIAPASATTLPPGFGQLDVVSGGTNLNAPTAVAYAPDGRTFVAEKAGRVKVVNPGATTASLLLDIRNNVNHFSDRGLLGIEVDTDFEQNGFLYLLYVAELNPQTTPRDTDQPMVSRLTRVTVRPDNTLEHPPGTSPETVILGKDSTPCPTPDNTRDCITADFYWHNIGTVRSDPSDGTLWLGTGDSHPGSPVNANTWRPYDENTFAGKIIHIDRNGRGLPGHPFCPGDNNLDHVCTKIYAKGFRNPFRFQLRPGKGPVVGDVGAGAKEEVDFIQPGRNYGWPCYEGTHKPPSRSSQAVCQQLYAKEGTAEAAIPPDWEYDHAGGASITLGPIYDGSTYPPHFKGDLFVGDYVKGWIKRLEIDANDNVTAVHDWATDWSGGVDLEMHPSGDLSDVDIGFGAEPPAVTRYTFSGSTNSPPTSVADATPTMGPPPLAVRFTGGGSSDPDGDALTFDWDFGDGTPHSSAANPSHTYTTEGDYTARLTVTDSQGNSSSDTVPIAVTPNQAPSAAITAPADESLYRNGNAVTLRGSASDPEDGPLTGESLSWRILLYHGTHIHALTDLSGEETSFTPLVDHDSDSYYEIRLTATDGGGRSSSQTIELRPQTSSLELASSPAGAPLAYEDEQQAAPFSRQPAIGYSAQLTAPETFVRGGRTYRFQGWSDGGARQHEISVPEGSPQYTATYRADGVDTLVFTPMADTYVDNLNPTTSYGALHDVEVDGSPEQRVALLKFNLSGIDGRQVLGARLALRQVDDPDGSPYGGDVHAVSSNSWSEATNWNTRPTLGAQLASFGPVVFGRGYEADLGASAVTADGLLSLGLRTPNADGSRWGSRESATPPRLIVEVAKYECADGADNDGDGKADFPQDPGCASLADDDENQPPVANLGATPTVGDAPLAVQFSGGGSIDPDGDALSYEWDFGDGSPHSSAASPSHTYAMPGSYTASLTVGDGHGHSATDSVEIEVAANEPPLAIVSATPTVGDAPLAVQFSGGGSMDPDGDALSYEWDFGDGTPHSSAASPSHTYAMPGDYTATLTVDDGHGHEHSASVAIRANSPAGEGGGTTDPPPGRGSGGTTDPPPGGGSGGTTDPLVQPPPFSGADIASGRVTVRRGAAWIEIACPADAAGSCVGRLVVSARLPATAGASAAARPKTLRLGTASFSIPSGDVARVRVKLSLRARRLLAQRRRLKVKAKAIARDGFLRERTTTSSLVLRMPRA